MYHWNSYSPTQRTLPILPRSPADPGFLAVSFPGSHRHHIDVRRAAESIGAMTINVESVGEHVDLASWGSIGEPFGTRRTIPLVRRPRRRNADVEPDQLEALLTMKHRADLADMLPPFAAMSLAENGTITAVTDAIGARHLYYTIGDGWAAVSTSPQALAVCADAPVDPEGVAVQSLLGWQVGLRTMFRGVSKLAAGAILTLAHGRVEVARYLADTQLSPLGIDEAVREAAALLRDYLRAYLDDHPDATLQLTGGQDSRLLLSAIPPERRKGLKVMTLSVPGSEDVAIAADLAQRYGMIHRVVGLDGLKAIGPHEAHGLCVSAARRLGSMADPLALAALTFAEARFEQGPRLSGLGGEVARGFYYVDPMLPIPVTKRGTSLLASWRMFANEAVEREALEPDFATWARAFTVDEIFGILRATGLPFWPATDEFYLGQRMQRWAGVTDTAVCFDREVANPMLDRRFLELARALPPQAKGGSKFLSRLQMELDQGLAMLPLDGRPPPYVFATRSLANTASQTMMVGRKAVNKALQRISRKRKPPAGGRVLATRVVEHWRQEPETLSAVRDLGIFRPQWWQDVLSGTLEPQPGTVAFTLNLLAAADRPQ